MDGFNLKRVLVVATFMVVIVSGCRTYDEIELDARHPEIRVSMAGVRFGEYFVEPADVPKILEDLGVPHDRTIHILLDGETQNRALGSQVMSRLAKSGYRRPVLVTERRAQSFTKNPVKLDEEHKRTPSGNRRRGR